MAISRMSLVQLLHKVGVEKDPNFVREAIKLLAEAVMELEVSIKAGAERYERSSERKVYRNGYRERRWDTQAGTVNLPVPQGSRGQLLSVHSRAPATCRPGFACGYSRSLRCWR